MNAQQLDAALAALPGSQDAGATGDGIIASRLLIGVEYARSSSVEEAKLRASYKRRHSGGAVPLVLVADDPEQMGYVRVLGPQRDGPLRRVRADSLLAVVERTLVVRRLQAVRLLAEELDRLDTERIAGLKVSGLGTEHLYDERLPHGPRWPALSEAVEGVSRSGWRELLTDLGYTIETLEPSGYLARAAGEPAFVVHPRAQAWQFARLDEQGRLPEGALVADCRKHGAPFGILAAGTRLRVLGAGAAESAITTRYLELDAAALEPERRPLLGLLAPAYIVGGEFAAVMSDARDYGQKLRHQLDRVLRQHVLPVLARELGRWARSDGRDLADDAVRDELEAAALLWVFRALFLLYAESAGHLPMQNPTYRDKSITRVAERAWEERDAADPVAAALWEDVAALVRRMRTGHTAWDLPAYNGDLFAAGSVVGASVLEAASVPDAALAPALVALARDEGDPEVGLDFSGLEIGHLGYIYEGLLSLRLSLADRDVAYDARSDRYVAARGEPDVEAGDLLWLTDEGGRKGGGVYYTRTELVRHLVRGAVGPAFDAHVERVRSQARDDPDGAAERLFDFAVLDPACGSAHFLVEVIDELADKIAHLLGEVALPGVARRLDELRKQAGSFGAGIEDTALLRRLVLKRCVYGVDLSAMGVEIAKVSLWLATFVPGLSLAYLDHNVQRGNALIGVARPEEVTTTSLFVDQLSQRLSLAAEAAARLQRIDDATPEQVAASRAADRELQAQVAGAKALFDLWTAEPFGLSGARAEAAVDGDAIVSGRLSGLTDAAGRLATREHFLHWPLAFAEVFARDRGGFDAVVGNPPWEEVTLEATSFYARYRPGLRALPEDARTEAIAELQAERPELVGVLGTELERSAELRGFFQGSGQFASSVGDPDLYKLFAQRYRSLVGNDGAIGVVLPRSVFAAKGSTAFREWLLDAAPPIRVDFLLNSGRWAFDMEPRYSVALLVARRGAPALGFEVSGVASSAAAFDRQAKTPGLFLWRNALGRLLEVPLLPDQASANLLAKLRSTEPFPFGGGRWRSFAVAEFHETNDASLWRGATEGRPLWKGASFDQYAPTGAGARRCPPSEAVLAKQRKQRPGSGALVAKSSTVGQRADAVARTVQRARVAFRDVTRATDSRSVRAALVPPDVFLTNKAPYLAFLDDDPVAEAACLGVMNSLPFDWQARRFVEINLNFFILEGLKVPALDDRRFDAVAEAAARLSVVDERYADAAAVLGVDLGALTDADRDLLRADVDAHVSHAWHLDAGDLETVLADFTSSAVTPAYRELVRRRFAALA